MLDAATRVASLVWVHPMTVSAATETSTALVATTARRGDRVAFRFLIGDFMCLSSLAVIRR
jgi:hypothetical protein